MQFRSKSADQALRELAHLATRHRRLSFHAVDNILDHNYWSTFLPRLREVGHDYRLFYEIKANLRKDQVMLLRQGGVTEIQPGLESLSTPILRLMRKGVSALQNIRLLKYCAELGIRVYWNIIYGFPREPIGEYDRMASLVTRLVHLEAPSLIRLGVERFSPYHERPEDYGLVILGPVAHYKFSYPIDDASLNDLAYSFDYEHADGRNPEAYVGRLRRSVGRWSKNSPRTFGSLRFRRGPEFLIISDHRTQFGPCEYRLGPTEAAIYLACDEGTRPLELQRSIDSSGLAAPKIEQIESFLQACDRAGLVYEEDGRYLSLALDTGSILFRNGSVEAPKERTSPSKLISLQSGSPIHGR